MTAILTLATIVTDPKRAMPLSKNPPKQIFVISSEQSQEDGCLNPLQVIYSSKDDVARMFGTHDWDVDSEKPYGEGGVVIHYSCKKCNAEGYSLVTTKDSSMSKEIEKRILNPFMETPRL